MTEATFGAGCFWCVEAIFRRLKGVIHVESGYAGGEIPDPTYREVCSGKTGHAEVIRLHFDPQIISYETLLRVFWHTHNPTTLNRQGADVGTQYRSVVFYHDDSQRDDALSVKGEIDAERVWDDPIVTEVTPLVNYFRAEDYHQDYFAENPNAPYCSAVIGPKVKKLEKAFPELLEPEGE